MKVIGYLTSGYPTIEKSIETARRYVEAGCDMLEISIPVYENREKPFLNQIMKDAFSLCPDYMKHMEAIQEMAKQNPDTAITILIYKEVIDEIGKERFADACLCAGIHDINSANLTDKEMISYFEERGVYLAGLINYNLDEWRIEEARHTKGFVYCQAFPRAGQNLKAEADSIEKLLPYIRSRGVTAPIYCGGGIAEPEDAKRCKDAGADGIFLGSSIIALYDEPEKLASIIKSFCDAVE